MPSYDPTRCNSSFAAIPAQGEMDGEFYTAEHRNPDVELHVGSKGFATYTENADKSGTVTWMLSQRSPTNRLLSAAFAAKVTGLIQIDDLSDETTLVTGADARIEKHAPVKRGNKVVGMEWKFLVPNLVIIAGGDQ